jgi:hypothetical protein
MIKVVQVTVTTDAPKAHSYEVVEQHSVLLVAIVHEGPSATTATNRTK